MDLDRETEKFLKVALHGGAIGGIGGLPFADAARSIELLASDVLPAVRRATATISDA